MLKHTACAISASACEAIDLIVQLLTMLAESRQDCSPSGHQEFQRLGWKLQTVQENFEIPEDLRLHIIVKSKTSFDDSCL